MRRILGLLILLTLTHCGYSVRNSERLPFQDINIAAITNQTFEPNIEDILYQKLADEFTKQGIGVSRSSEFKLEGTLKKFILRVVSEKDEFSTEYEVLIQADFDIVGPEGFKKEFPSMHSPFIESFIAERDLNSIVSFKEIATEQALESLAKRLITEVVYR